MCVCVCVCVLCTDAFRVQKRELAPLELELFKSADVSFVISLIVLNLGNPFLSAQTREGLPRALLPFFLLCQFS